MKTIFSTNPRVQGEKNYAFSIVPGTPIAEQIKAQISGVNASTEEVIVLHPIPGVGSSICAFLRGKNNTFPTIALIGPDGINKGELNLHDFRHNQARPKRATFLATEDNLSQDAVIIVNASGREVPEHQKAELSELAGTQTLVFANLQLGQIDLGQNGLVEWLLEELTKALSSAGIGNSIASRRVIMITAGLSPVNAILVTALHALCESWCSQPVAENKEGTFHFTDLIQLEKMEALGRTASAGSAPVLVPKDVFEQLLNEHPEGTSLGDELRKINQ